MELPFDRERLEMRNARDSDEERAAAGYRSPGESFMETMELCEVVARLASATLRERPVTALEAKALLYVRPLRAAMHS